MDVRKAKAILRGEDPDEVLGKISKDGLTLSEFLSDAEHETEQRYGYWVKASRKSGEAILARLQSCFGKLGKRPLSELTPSVLERWITDRKKAGLKAETINRDVGALKSALTKAVEWKLISTHPLKGLKPLKVDKRRVSQRALTPKEETALIAALEIRELRMRAERDSHNRWRHERHLDPLPSLEERFADHLLPAVLISLNTGLRRNELFSLTWGAVDFRAKRLTVKGDTAKSGDTRTIPLNDDAANVLRLWKLQTGGGGLVFANKGKQFGNLKRAYYAALKSAGIDRTAGNDGAVVWHSLRHTFGTKLARARVPPHTVQKLMGHANLVTTQRYFHSHEDELKAAVQKLGRQDG